MTTETYVIDAKGRATIDKDPQATLDYTFDWTDWLAGVVDGINTATASVDADSGCSVEATTVASGKVTAWVSGGTIGKTAVLTCHIITTGGREDDRSVYLKIKER